MEKKKGTRIAKVLARAGLCSRREAERWIAQGRVSIGENVLESPAINVHCDEKVYVDGSPIPKKEKVRVWRFNKPRGLITTNNDPLGRPTVFQRLPRFLPRVVSVGRLDLSSEGLLLFTNDGELARRLELPLTGWVRRYRVRVFGKVNENNLKELENGQIISGIRYGPIEATLDTKKGYNSWLTVSLREGKNREIRRIMEYLGLNVNRLIRVSYGPFYLGKLGVGEIDEVSSRILRKDLVLKS